MVFGFFKKKKLDYDPSDIKVTDLKPGFVFEYDMKNWEVLDSYTYDWGDNCYSREHQISDGLSTKYLTVEQDDDLELYLYEKVKNRAVDCDLIDEMNRFDKLPTKIRFEDQEYVLEEEAAGYMATEKNPKTWVEMVSWDYYCKSEKNKYLCIEQWDTNDFEVSSGIQIEQFEISNINPA